MKKHVINTVCFLAIGFFILRGFDYLLTPTYYEDKELSTAYVTHNDIYELEENTLDAAFVGSSHVYCTISPEDIFEESGITSYAYASSGQHFYQSYYFIEDIFRHQNPKVIFLDTYSIYDIDRENDEIHKHYAADWMQFSLTKLKLAYVGCQMDEEDSVINYMFPSFRYHDRIYELVPGDYDHSLVHKGSTSKGLALFTSSVPGEYDYAPMFEDFDMDSFAGILPGGTDDLQMSDGNIADLNAIKALCESHGAKLILIKTPTNGWSILMHTSIQNWADENNVPFIDMNENIEIRDEVNIDWATDTMDGGNHLNYSGAKKCSSWWARYLTENFDFKDKRNDEDFASWHEDYNAMQQRVKELNAAEDITNEENK